MTVPNIPVSATVVAASGVAFSQFGDELVVLDLRDGVYYGLDSVGARIWELVQTPVSVTGILEVLVAEYDVEPDRCEREIGSLLVQLVDKGLLEIRGA